MWIHGAEGEDISQGVCIHTACCSVGGGGALDVCGGQVGGPLLSHGVGAVDWTALPELQGGSEFC